MVAPHFSGTNFHMRSTRSDHVDHTYSSSLAISFGHQYRCCCHDKHFCRYMALLHFDGKESERKAQQYSDDDKSLTFYGSCAQSSIFNCDVIERVWRISSSLIMTMLWRHNDFFSVFSFVVSLLVWIIEAAIGFVLRHFKIISTRILMDILFVGMFVMFVASNLFNEFTT